MKQVPPWFVPVPKSTCSKSHIKLWDLKYRGAIVAGYSGKAYPVCKAKENELVLAGSHGRKHFTITEHK